MRELHFIPFKAAVEEANIYSLMPYHEVDGIPVHASKWLLTDVLRKEWGFKGYVFSDYGVIGMLDQFHRTSHNKTESAVQAFTAGVDLEAPGRYAYGELVRLVQDGTIPAAMVDSSVARVLRIKFKLGLFDRPFRYNAQQARKIIHRKDHIELSQRIAEESIVLLKNEEQLLPLSKKNLKRIAVIGPNADKVQFGDYSVTKSNGWDKGNLDMDYNLLWHVDGQPEFGKMTFEEWKKARGGQHSVIMDPMFEDAEHDNYHFRSLKAAKKIGFKVFDTSIVGVYESDSWKKKAEMSPELIEKFQAAAKVRLAK